MHIFNLCTHQSRLLVYLWHCLDNRYLNPVQYVAMAINMLFNKIGTVMKIEKCDYLYSITKKCHAIRNVVKNHMHREQDGWNSTGKISMMDRWIDYESEK